MMRKMMSIVFLLLVLLISLGLSAYTQLTEGMESEEQSEGAMDIQNLETEMENVGVPFDEAVKPDEEPEPEPEPVEDSCTETMTNYR